MDTTEPKPDPKAAPTDDEIMLNFGRAVFEAQRFEHLLCTAVMMLTVQKGDRTPFLGKDGNPDESKVADYLEKLERLTLGQLKGELEKLQVLNDSAIAHVVELNRTRKRLVHHFLTDTDEALQTTDGRKSVLHDLTKARREFEAAASVLRNALVEGIVRQKTGAAGKQ